MTALTASHLLESDFKNKQQQQSANVVNGSQIRDSKDQFEFVDGGILHPFSLPHGVTFLRPKDSPSSSSASQVLALCNGDATGKQVNGSAAQSNGFKYIFKVDNEHSPIHDNGDDSSPEGGATSSSYPSSGNTPESYTKELTDVPSPETIVDAPTAIPAAVNGLSVSVDDAEEGEIKDDDPDSEPEPVPLPSTPKPTPKRIQLQRASPSPPPRLIGPVIPPEHLAKFKSQQTSSPSTVNENGRCSALAETTPVKNTVSNLSMSPPNTVPRQAQKRKRLLSDRFESEAKYPIIEPSIARLSSWNGFASVQNLSALAGIINPHNNCFLNSVLQSLLHIPYFARFIVEQHKPGCQKCRGPSCIICPLRSHFFNATNQDVVRAHTWINSHFAEIFPNHTAGSQEDAHEMLLLLLDAIDRQLQEKGRSQPGKNSSAIEQIFDGKIRCEYTCMRCKKTSICYEPIRGLNVELGDFQSQPTVEKIVLDHFRNEKISAYGCRACSTKSSATKRTRVVTAPKVLIVHLKRFIRFTKNTTKVICSRRLSLTEVSVNTGRTASYRYLGCIKHLGSSIHSGHYVAQMFGFDGGFYNFNDDSVTRLSFPSENEPSQPYILFYALDGDSTANGHRNQNNNHHSNNTRRVSSSPMPKRPNNAKSSASVPSSPSTTTLALTYNNGKGF